MTDRIPGATIWLRTLFFLVVGAWAFFAPRSFFDEIAPWKPFKEHFLHDAGALAIGLGLGLAASLLRSAAPALVGGAGASVFHALAHILDHGKGGVASDRYVLTALALILLAAAVR